MKLAKWIKVISALMLLLALAPASADRNALWRIIDDHCVPGFVNGPSIKPCARVEMPADREHGWVLLKDRRGVLQYLLMPSAQIPGKRPVIPS